MRIELFGKEVVDTYMSNTEGECVVILGVVIFLIMMIAPLWKWW